MNANSPEELTSASPGERDAHVRERDEREVENGFRQYDAAIAVIESHVIDKRPFALRASMIQQLQKIAVDGIEPTAGEYRSEKVEIWGSKHEPSPAFRVRDLVQEMCDYVNDNLHEKSAFHLAAYIMWRLNWIHPFPDGNGRTSRIISYIVLSAKLGYVLPGSPTIPEQIQQDRTGYFAALEAADRAIENGGEVDVSEMEKLLKGMLARQLLSVITAADGSASEWS